MPSRAPRRRVCPTDMSNEDEVRVQRTEEELRVGTRERKAGAIRVRKRL